ALLDLRSALEDEPFEPGYTRQRFAIAVNNYAAIALAGAIVLRARALAPGVQIRLRPSGTLDVADLLDRGELDLALVSGAPPLARYGSALLIEDDFVAVVRQGHPLLGAPLDSAGFAAQAHLTISSSGDDLTGLDEALARQGLARNSEIEVPYLSAGAVLTQSDMMAIMARQIAVAFARVHPVALVELPLQPAPLRQMLVWQRRFEDQAAQRWLRETIASVAADLRSAR
ncbi:MAG TPA: LysR substrate-binding domain-containing protein, partial [Novosphingobium sp.]|nr:LysR substrate-binding domain-containing protein [Novosphingobium sp.]